MKRQRVRLAGTTRANGKYHFSEEEKRKLGKDLANHEFDRDMLKDEAKAIASNYKGKLDRIASEITRLSHCIRNGYEFRDFECHVDIDWAKNMKFYVAVETGKVVTERALDPSDYQLKLDLDKPKTEKEKPAHEDHRPNGPEHQKP